MRMLETSRITFCLEASNETLVLETCRLCLEIYSLVRNGVTFGSLARNVRVEDFLLHFLEESQAKRLILRLRTSLWRKSRTRVSSNNVTQEPATILTQERYMSVPEGVSCKRLSVSKCRGRHITNKRASGKSRGMLEESVRHAMLGSDPRAKLIQTRT